MNYLGEEASQVGYLGEVRPGMDGNLYAWTHGIDGLGQPVGFWRLVRRNRGPYLRPVVSWRGMAGYDGYGGLDAEEELRGLDEAAYVGGLDAEEMVSGFAADEMVSGLSADEAFSGFAAGDEMQVQGLGADELNEMMGIGYLGEVRPGPDGNLYAWVEGIDGLGNPVGFWSRLKRLRKRLKPFLRRALPMATRFASMIPGTGTIVAAGLRTATPYLQRAGMAGYGGYEGLAGYEGFAAEEDLRGYGAEEDLRGFAAEEELRGYGAEEDLRGFAADEELRGFGADEELRGFGAEEELRGFAADEELRGFGAVDDLQGFAAEEDLRGLYGYVPEGMQGVEGYVPVEPPRTRVFSRPAQPPDMWKPLW